MKVSKTSNQEEITQVESKEAIQKAVQPEPGQPADNNGRVQGMSTLRRFLCDSGRAKKIVCRGIPKLCGRVIVIAPRRTLLDGRGRKVTRKGTRKSAAVDLDMVKTEKCDEPSVDLSNTSRCSWEETEKTCEQPACGKQTPQQSTPLKRARDSTDIDGTPISKQLHSPCDSRPNCLHLNTTSTDASQSDLSSNNDFTPIKQKQVQLLINISLNLNINDTVKKHNVVL